MKNIIHKILSELSLFLQSPKRYLYLFTYPTDKYVTIEDFDKRLKVKGKKIAARMQRQFPNSKVHFYGSVALELPGTGDLDLAMETDYDKFDDYARKIKVLFGEADLAKPDFVIWSYEEDGCKVELSLVTPDSHELKISNQMFETLSKKEVKKEYIKLKLSSNGISVRSYERKKLEFYNNFGLYD